MWVWGVDEGVIVVPLGTGRMWAFFNTPSLCFETTKNCFHYFFSHTSTYAHTHCMVKKKKKNMSCCHQIKTVSDK